MTKTGPNGDSEDQVICLASGSKGIRGMNLSKTGDVLNDSHAEILVKRCFKFFLYDKIEEHLLNPTSPDSIFEEIRTPDRPDDFRLQVKSNIAFHLYISSAPCGDGRMFNFNQSSKKSKDILSYGILRTKTDGKPGIIPTYLSEPNIHIINFLEKFYL